MSAFEDAMAHVDQEAIAKLTMEMVDIPSPMGGEKDLALYLEGRFRAAGLETKLQEVEPDRYNVLGYLRGTGGGPNLMYCGHLDSTYGGDEEGIRDLGPGYQPKSWRDGDWVYGMGTYNMKAGHASSILAVEAMARSKAKLKGDLIIAGVVGETNHVPVGRYQGKRYRGCGVGARFMINNGITADMVVVPEPTSNRISVGTGGYVYFQLSTRGNPAATYSRGGAAVDIQLGEDAIEKMLKVIPAIKDWGADYLRKTKFRGKPAGNVNIIAIEGGHPFRPSKLPCFCHVYLEVGHMAGQLHCDIIDDVTAVARQLERNDPTMQVETQVIQAVFPSEVSTDEYVVHRVSAAHEQVWGERPEITWDGWYADTAPLTHVGIPAICYGPQGRARGGGAGYYPKEGEQAHIGDLTRGTEVFVRTAIDVCNSDRSSMRGSNTL